MMRNTILLAVAAALCLPGCNTSQPEPNNQSMVKKQSVFVHEVGHAGWKAEETANRCRIPYQRPEDYVPSTGTGERVETAIVFQGTLIERTGIAAEYAYISRHLPGWEICGQTLLTPGPRIYDQVDLTNAAGQKRSIYFDITTWFGKWT